jgi:hypothetical protein
MNNLWQLLIVSVVVLVVWFVSRAVQGPTTQDRAQKRPGFVGVMIVAFLAAALTWIHSVYLFK